jgi:hypothetical protein
MECSPAAAATADGDIEMGRGSTGAPLTIGSGGDTATMIGV